MLDVLYDLIRRRATWQSPRERFSGTFAHYLRSTALVATIAVSAREVLNIRKSDAAMKKVSIVTISYNQGEFLEKAIQSVLEQRGIDLEYIIVDAGSLDGSRDIIAKYAGHLTATILEPDNGPADGLNKGLARCTGEFFGFLNADDELLPNALSEAVSLFDQNPTVDVMYGASWQIDEAGQRVKLLVGTAQFDARRYAQGIAYIVQQSAFMRLNAVRSMVGFDVNNRTSWDGELFYRMAKRGYRFRRVHRTWASFRVYKNSITGSGSLLTQFRTHQAALFREFFGREKRGRDLIASTLWYAIDLVGDPYRVAVRLRNSVGINHG